MVLNMGDIRMHPIQKTEHLERTQEFRMQVETRFTSFTTLECLEDPPGNFLAMKRNMIPTERMKPEDFTAQMER